MTARNVFSRLSLTFRRSCFPRLIISLGSVLFLSAISLWWQPGERAHASARLTFAAPPGFEGEAFTLPEAKVAAVYEFQFQTEGGLAPLKWSLAGGALPPGLRLEENGALRGVPAQAKAEAYTFTVEVADSARTPQRFALPCLLAVEAAPLRIVTRGAPLRIVTGSKPVAEEANSLIADASEGAFAGSIQPVAPNNNVRSMGTPMTINSKAALLNNPMVGIANVNLATAQAATTIKAPYFKQPIIGAQFISGIAPKKVKLTVLVNGEAVNLKDGKGVEQAALDVSGDFNVALAKPLSNKAETIALGVEDDSGAQAATEDIPILKNGDIYDWGRVRAYFTAGVMFSKERESFSQQDFSIGFNLDKNWWQRDATKIATDNRHPFSHFNTFFETRITSAPVLTKNPAGSTASESTDSDQETGCSSGIDCFLASRKVAMMQVGGYLPMTFKPFRWDFDGQANVVFLAPLAKAGIQTITSREEGLPSDDVYNFFSFGTRLGHFKLGEQNRSPELISYLDLTYGKWENFDLRRGLGSDGKPVTDPMKVVYTLRRRPFRIGAEGRLKIPQTPMFVGFDGNFGDGPDDLRFILGTRFDVGKLIGRLQKLRDF
jgi:hypothetical protein